MKKLLLILALLIGSLVFAQEHTYEISPMVGYNVAESNLGVKNDGYFVGGVEAQYNIQDFIFNPELSVFGTKNADYKVPNNAYTDILRIAINGIYSFDKIGSIIPFAKAGAGYETVYYETVSNESGFFLDTGAGVKMFIMDNIALKFEGLYMAKPGGNPTRNVDSNFMALAGLTFTFGRATSIAAPIVVNGDYDNDGVADSIDQCLYTPDNTPVDTNGCAFYDDKDGISNTVDKYSQTAFGTKVDKKGCNTSNDCDNDGVLNANDLCPRSSKGEVVNIYGCTKVVNLHVNFGRDSFVIEDGSMKGIHKYAHFLLTHPDLSANIVGYTDSRASRSHNRELSLRRAKVVVEALIEEGVNRNNLKAIGVGEAEPIADNTTCEGRAQNRRVEAELIRK